MKYPTVAEIIVLHDALIAATGGSSGLRDEGLLRSAHGQPLATFGGVDLYPTIHTKAAALLFSLIKNHPFVDGYLFRIMSKQRNAEHPHLAQKRRVPACSKT